MFEIYLFKINNVHVSFTLKPVQIMICYSYTIALSGLNARLEHTI